MLVWLRSVLLRICIDFLNKTSAWSFKENVNRIKQQNEGSTMHQLTASTRGIFLSWEGSRKFSKYCTNAVFNTPTQVAKNVP